MNFFITGIDGYIGSVLRKKLLDLGHNVSGMDTEYYRSDKESPTSDKSIIWGDIRNISETQLRGFDTVIHLADLSNDPLGLIDENVTREINYVGAVNFAKTAKQAGVKRYVYSSSCSVYGNHTEFPADESSQTSPQTMYAKCKLEVERDISALADNSFSPVFLRNSTVFGTSPNMRYDLVVNKLAADAYLYNKIIIESGGNQWRPLIHIEDVSRAFISASEAPRDIVHNEIFNVGCSNGNFKISEIGELILLEFPGCKLDLGELKNFDSRSYRVSFEKIHKNFPDFFCRHTVRSGIRELSEYFKQSGFNEEIYTALDRTRAKKFKHLIQSKKLDSHFFWNYENTHLPVL